MVVPLALAACSPPPLATPPQPTPDARGSHVHGVAVAPMSSTVLLATHDGLLDASKEPAVKIGGSLDLMGFTPTGNPNIFYASGHPGAGSSLPNPLGLIRSKDGGKTWDPVSRQGQSDFHALTATKRGLVAFDGTVLTSTDGTAWTPAAATFAPAMLAGTPTSDVVLATTQEGLQRSTDGGRSWQINPSAPVIQFTAFATPDDGATTEAIGVTPDGAVSISADAGLSWVRTGRISGEVQAVAAMEGTAGKPWIWAATAEGVQVSTDGGRVFRPATTGTSQ